jgi:hypothetical protein
MQCNLADIYLQAANLLSPSHKKKRLLFHAWRTEGSSETLVNIYHNAWRHIPDDRIFIFTTVGTSNLTSMNDD